MGYPSIRLEDRLDEAQALRFDPRRGHGGDADGAEAIARSGRRPPFPRRALDLAMNHDAVPRVVAEDERRGEPAARREGESDTGIGVVALDVLAHRRLVTHGLELGHDRLEHGAHDGVQPLAAHPAIGLIGSRDSQPRSTMRRSAASLSSSSPRTPRSTDSAGNTASVASPMNFTTRPPAAATVRPATS